MSWQEVIIITALATVFAGGPTPQPAQTPDPTLTGVASWYEYVPGGAAAGPQLRKLLGKHWRGQTVTVCTRTDRCTKVKLSDWCQCYWKQDKERIIDLDVRSFAKLADPARGITTVTVTAELVGD